MEVGRGTDGVWLMVLYGEICSGSGVSVVRVSDGLMLPV